MSENEEKLLELIRCSREPMQAAKVAVRAILDFLERPQSSQAPSSETPEE